MADLATDSLYPAPILVTDTDVLDGAPSDQRYSERVKKFLESLSPSGAVAYDTGWTTYTPTLTGLTAGATIAGRYRRWGMEVMVQVVITCTGALTISGNGPQFSLPFAYPSLNAHEPIGEVTLIDTSATGRYRGVLIAPGVGATTAIIRAQAASLGQHSTMSATVPFTWGATDLMLCVLKYPVS